jgi:phage major head subunit gpT-like protein
MVRGEFASQMEALKAKDIYREIATVVTSNTKSNTYGWRGKFPKIREWG